MRRLAHPADALGLLTLIPVSQAHAKPRADADVAAWFPFVGATLGVAALVVVSIVVGASAVLADGWVLGRTGFLVATVIIAVWAALTRLLHWDGLADTADALWGGHTPERRLEIMDDSRVGAFGVTAVAVVLALQVTALGSLLTYTAPAIWIPAVVAAPILGRTAATFGCWLGAPARPDGLGASVVGRPSGVGAVLLFTLLIGATLLLVASGSLRWILWWPLSIVLTLLVPHVLARSVGGVTGDNLGASILCVETAVLVGAALAGGL